MSKTVFDQHRVFGNFHLSIFISNDLDTDIELKKRFTALEECDDIDSLNKNMTEMIQQSAMSIAKHTKRPKIRNYHRLQELR